MDVGHLRTARGGSDFLDYGTGDVRVKILGDQDEDVDIDDGDTDVSPFIDASSAGAANIGSSLSSHGRREPHTAGSQASIGRQTLAQPAVRDGSPKHSDVSVPKVHTEGNSKRMHASEYRKHISKSRSRSRKLPRVQTLSKRKTLEMEPSTSTPIKRAKLHGSPSDSFDVVRESNKSDEVRRRDVTLSTRKEDLPLEREEIIEEGEGEGTEKSQPRSSGVVTQKHPRVLVLGDESEEDMLEQDELSASHKSHAEGKKLAAVEAAGERSTKNDSHAVGLAKTEPAGESDLVPLRSAFPLHAKKKGSRVVSGDSRSNTGAGLATHIADQNSSWKWVTCTKCKKTRLVSADEDLKPSSWCCAKNTRNPKYSSCSAPQEFNNHRRAEGSYACKPETLSERDARDEGQEMLNQSSPLTKGKAQRNMVWVKVDGKGFWWPGLIVTVVPPAVQKKLDESKDTPKAVWLFHPRKDVEEYQVVKRSALKPFDIFINTYKDSSSHPDFIVAVIKAEQYFAQPDTQMGGSSQFVTGSEEGAMLSVVEVEDVPREHAESNELVFENAEVPRDDPECSQPQAENKMEHLEEGEVNQAAGESGTGDISPEAGNGHELEFEVPRDDPECSQPQAENKMEHLEEGEVNQAAVESGTGDISPEAGNGHELVFEVPRDDPECSQPQAENKMEHLEEGEVNQAAVESGTGDISPEAGNGHELVFEVPRDDPECNQPQAENKMEHLEEGEVNQAAVETGTGDISPEAGNGHELVFEVPRDDPECSQPQAENKMEHLEGGEVNQAAVETGTGDISPEAGNGDGLNDRRDHIQLSQPQVYKERGVLEDEEVIQVPVEQGKAEVSLEIDHGDVPVIKRNDPQFGLSQGDQVENGIPDACVVNCSGTGASEQEMVQKSPEGINGSDAIDKMDGVSSSAAAMSEMEGSEEIPISAKVFEDDELSERTKVSEASDFQELYIPGEKLVLNLEISPTRRLIEYDDTAMELYFLDGAVVNFDRSVGKVFHKCSTGLTLRECIRKVGKSDVRQRFPHRSKSSIGLKFNDLDQNADFTTRLRDTWLREYKDEPMPEYFQTRFVAGCIMEERGELVNWAYELTRLVKSELREISRKEREALSPGALQLLLHVLENGVDQAEALKGEEPVENGIKLHSDDVFRQEPEGVAGSSTFVGEIEMLECRPNVDSRTTLEVDMLTTEVVGELPNSMSNQRCCVSGADILEEAANNKTKDDAHQLSNDNVAHENEHTALVFVENNNVVGDLCLSQMNSDAPVGEELQIRRSPGLVVDSIQTEKHKLSIDPAESDLEEGQISPSELAETFQVDTASKIPCSLTPPLTQEVSARVELRYEEDDFPSSDDHNSICNECEVGGELMYVTTPSFPPAPSSSLLLCDGKGCKAVYHKECLDPPLQTVPAGVWYCPECEKRKVGKVWSVRSVCENSKPIGRASSSRSDNEDEAQDEMPLDARFKSSLQRPDGEVAANDLGRTPASRAGIANTSLKDECMEYLVQWKSRSHAHDKWVSEKELEKLAPKELARFKKSSQLGQVKYESEWAEPERVIQKRLTRVTRRQPDAVGERGNVSKHQNVETEWFVKWKGLGYEYCTWEPAGAGVLSTSRGIELINAYERWSDAAKHRARRESQEEAENRVQSPFKASDCQPELTIRLEQEQLDAFSKLLKMWHSRMNGIVVYGASQEKIVMTIMFFLSLVEYFRVVHPILVVVPKSLIQIWEHELYQWAPKLYIVNYASKLEEARDVIRRAEFSSFSEPFRPQIVLTTFDVINCDTEYLKKVDWEVLIIDESRSHRVQKSCQKSYRPLSQINSNFRLLLLSEPLKSNVDELIQFINFLEPRKIGSPTGDELTEVAELRRRLAGRVFEYIPKSRLTEYWVPVEMTPVHLDQYYNLLVRHYPTLSRNHRDHQIQEVVTKLRQVRCDPKQGLAVEDWKSCNHPFLADLALEGTMGQGLTPKELLDHHIEISGKMRLLHLMMPILKAAGWRVLIFSQETKQLDILERYMTQSHGSDSYERVDHDIAVNTNEAAMQRFNAEGSKRFVLLLKTGVHVSFKSVQFVLVYDSDWNPENDMRALHKIHNEGEAGSKPLPVIRLYTHLTVEESMLALSRDVQLPSTRAGFSAKICQKLLTWGASKIFDQFDNRKGPTGSSCRPKGAKVCPKAKLNQVVYNVELVSNLLEALLCQEEGSSKVEGDELLESILVPRDEPAPLFAESDYGINMIMDDSAQDFWASSLKWRYDDWLARKASTLGKGQRGRKRVTYDEDAMASAVFEKAQLFEESERKRPRRRKASSPEEQEVVAGPSDPRSFQQELPSPSNRLPSERNLLVTSSQLDTTLLSNSTLPATSAQVDTALPSDIPDQLQENTDASQLQPLKVVGSAHGLSKHHHASNRNAGSEKNPSNKPEIAPYESFPEFLSRICSMLELPEFVKERVDEMFFKHLLKYQANLCIPRMKHEICAIQLCVVWLAAEQLNHPIDKFTSKCMVENSFGVTYTDRKQFEGDLYTKVRELCSNFNPRPDPPVVAATPSQPALVPEIIPRATSFKDMQPQAIDAEESAHVEGEEGAQESGLQVEAEVHMLGSPAVQVTLPVDNAPEVLGAPVAVEAVDGAWDTEVVLVVADPRLVPEEHLDKSINQNQVPEHEPIQLPAGTVISGASSLEQGLGWVLVDPASVIPVEASSRVKQQPLEATVPEHASNSDSRIDSLQSSQVGATPATATLGACPVEMPAQVLPIEPTQSARQIEATAAALLASSRNRFNQDKDFVIKVQCKEMKSRKEEADRRLQVLENDYRRQRSSPVPGLVEEREKKYKQDKKNLERENYADLKALAIRQRERRDTLDGLYKKLLSCFSTGGSGSDVQMIEEEIEKIKEYYKNILLRTPSTPSSLQRSVDRHPASTSVPPNTSANEALLTSRVQADRSLHVAQPTANPAEDHQRLGRVSSSGTPAVASQRGHAVEAVIGQDFPHSQRSAEISAAPMQRSSVQPVTRHYQRRGATESSSVQTRGQVQRSNAAPLSSPTPNVQGGVPAVSRSPGTVGMAPAVPPSVGNMTRPSAPATVAPLTGNVPGPSSSDMLLREKGKLSRAMETAKIAYETESRRIKAEYDREAEILHKRYETLLVEQHRSYSMRQQQFQQNIVKVEWNRQLVEVLKLRDELEARAAVFAGLATQTAVQPLGNQQTPQPMSGRLRSTAAPVHANISRSNATTVNAGPGIIMQPLGTSSTPVSIARAHHSPRNGMPAASQNLHPRSSMAEAMAVLEATGNAVGPGVNVTGISRAQTESVTPEVNTDAAVSPQPESLAPTSLTFQDPILAIIRNSMCSAEEISPNAPDTTGLTSAGASLPDSHLPEPTVPPTAGVESQVQPSQALPQTNPPVTGVETQVQASQASPQRNPFVAGVGSQVQSSQAIPQGNPGADSDFVVVEEIPVQMSSHVSSGSREQVPPANTVTPAGPHSLIYLSDSDED